MNPHHVAGLAGLEVGIVPIPETGMDSGRPELGPVDTGIMESTSSGTITSSSWRPEADRCIMIPVRVRSPQSAVRFRGPPRKRNIGGCRVDACKTPQLCLDGNQGLAPGLMQRPEAI